MTRIILALALLLVPSLATAGHEMPCGPRENVLKTLEDKYGESQFGRGVAGNQFVVEVYASEETGTWTILRTDASGLSCIMAAGDRWQGIEPPPPSETL